MERTFTNSRLVLVVPPAFSVPASTRAFRLLASPHGTMNRE